ncbi:DUF805 domain-containing protein [Limimaricola variabilis]
MQAIIETLQDVRDNFSFGGTTSRSQYWGYFVSLSAISYFVKWLVSEPASNLAVWLILMAFVLSVACGWLLYIPLLLRRVRDAGFSVWWALSPFLMLALSRLIVLMGQALKVDTTAIVHASIIAIMALNLWVLIITLLPTRKSRVSVNSA